MTSVSSKKAFGLISICHFWVLRGPERGLAAGLGGLVMDHSLVLDSEGGVREAGYSSSSGSSLHFQRLSDLPCISFVAAGLSHSAAIDTEGGHFAFGCGRATPISLGRVFFLNEWKDSLQSPRWLCGNSFLIAEAEEGLRWCGPD